MASGVKLDPDCVDAFNNFKLGKKEAFIVYGFSADLTKIVVYHKEPKQPAADDSARSKSNYFNSK